MIGNVINHVIGHVIRSLPAVKPNSLTRLHQWTLITAS
jgi:hypothetical protein